MCGIAGVISAALEGPEERLRPAYAAMLDPLRERGPDARCEWRGDGVWLGHCRLRIIDLSAAADQPLVSASGHEVVVFNGEIYNHRALRGELQRAGHRFRTQSDTEVLLHGYQEWGAGLVERLAGMFALVLWDARRGRVLLARDRLGKKPLYYSLTGSELVVASNVKSVLLGLRRRPEVDHGALADYLTLFSIPEACSIYQGVRKLPAAHLALLEREDLRAPAGAALPVRRYWRVSFQPKIGWHEDDVVERLDRALRRAVRRRLESDVPLGVFLSGGIDSSLVTALAAQEVPNLRTISARFSARGHDESPFARQVAERYGTEHVEVPVGETSLDLVPELVWQFGEPFADSSAIAQYQVAKAAREFVTVVLTGDGGDELFGGYRRYLLAAPQIWLRQRLPDSVLLAGQPLVGLLSRMARRSPDATRGFLGSLERERAPYFLFHTWALDLDRLLAPAFRRRLIEESAGPDFLTAGFDHYAPGQASAPRGRTALDRLLEADLAYWLPADMLTKVDVATMAASLEARSPLLDHELAEFAARLSWQAKVEPRRLKKVLRLLARRYLPPEVVDKPKWGFVVPVDQWLASPGMRDLFRHYLLSDRTRARGLFDYAFVEELFEEHLSGRVNHKHRLWSLFSLEAWFRMFVDGDLDRRHSLVEEAAMLAGK